MQDKNSSKIFTVGAREGAVAVYKQVTNHIGMIKKIVDAGKEKEEPDLFTAEDISKLLKSLEDRIQKDAALAEALYNLEIDTLRGVNPYEGNC